jgi:hypothetical protein
MIEGVYLYIHVSTYVYNVSTWCVFTRCMSSKPVRVCLLALGMDSNPCGGTHVRNLSELQCVKVNVRGPVVCAVCLWCMLMHIYVCSIDDAYNTV